MNIVSYLRNKRWLAERRNEYPHRCRTDVGYPSPVDVYRTLPGMRFIRAPLFKEAEWGFQRRAEMVAFKQTFITKDNER